MENKREGNIYDKIVKENIESIIPALMNSVLGFKVLESVVIKEKLQQTKEKEADVLRIITDPSERKFILHLEFQVDDYKKMVYRMVDYWGLLKSKYSLPVRQFVIYIGGKVPTMKTVLSEDGNYFQFQLININQLDYLRFLNSTNPEKIIWAILAMKNQKRLFITPFNDLKKLKSIKIRYKNISTSCVFSQSCVDWT
jgi:hypothetical protein